ncbi:MAG: LamG-like jellyroll fold domain-containing protein [Polyangiaceae bacterium]
MTRKINGRGSWSRVPGGVGLVGIALSASGGGCVLFEQFSITETGGTGGMGPTSANASKAANASSSNGSTSDATSATDATSSAALSAASSGAGGACACTNLVSAYLFDNAMNLGRDLLVHNDFTDVTGSPAQSSLTPPGMPGHSLSLDGGSSLCLLSGFTFDSTKDHTLCWWARPAALGDSTNQFAQTCGYDTWTENSGKSYQWRINNCNGGTPNNLVVPNVYAVDTWVQICQTYTAASLTREVVINGQTNQKTTLVDPDPILEPSDRSWCIGSYGGGGYWTGLLYRPLWFDRVLSDAEIQAVSANGCCLE